MKNRSIGKIVSINNGKILAEISANIGDYINTLTGISFVGEVGSYVIIHDYDKDIVCEITGIDESLDLTKRLNQYVKPSSTRYVSLSLLGEIFDNNFSFGVTRLPRIFMEINLISKSELDIILDVKNSEMPVNKSTSSTYLKSLSIGKSVIFDNYDVKVNLNNFFGYHFGIFGNTGAGKSNTIANIIQKIFIKKDRSATGAHIIIVDSNGEYDNAFKNISYNNTDIKYKNIVLSPDNYEFDIPVWALSVDDLSILLNASEKTQIPIINKAIQIVKLNGLYDHDTKTYEEIKNHIIAKVVFGIITSSDASGTKGDKIKSFLQNFSSKNINEFTNITYDDDNKPVNIKLINALSLKYGNIIYTNNIIEICKENFTEKNIFELLNDIPNYHYSLEQFYDAMKLSIAYDGSINSQKIYEFTAPMITRLDSLINSPIGKLFSKTNFKDTNEFIENTFTDSQLINLDISGMDDNYSEVILRVISKMILDFQKTNKNLKKLYPINLIIEEAHRYVYSRNSYDFDIFERISKEGRKFGLLLGISSQRPSELSRTVVSQCSNFIIHRIQNPDDLAYISKMIPNANNDIINRLTYLNTGSALVFGTSINIPTLTKFQLSYPSTDSSSSKISKEWFKINK